MKYSRGRRDRDRMVVEFTTTVHGHKYSSPSMCYYIFHIKPHFFLWADFYEIYFKIRRIL